MRKHVGVLEEAGLVVTEGRPRTAADRARRLEDVAAWIERYQRIEDARLRSERAGVVERGC